MDLGIQEADKLQRAIARLIAMSPAGVQLLLIGGFRYRLLDDSQRFSVDIDYHWGGNLQEKQKELHSLCRRVVLKEVKRVFGYEGSVSRLQETDAESPNAALIELRFWQAGRAIEIPIEITRIICLDPPVVRVADGTVHATASDADVIEGKVLAVLNRLYIQHRDFVDIFLYGDRLRPDSPQRMQKKMHALSLSAEAVRKRLRDLDHHRKYHEDAIQKVIATQMNPNVAEQLNAGGGGRTVLSESLKFVKRVCPQ